MRRIGTLNCGHAAFPIILGVSRPQYTPEELQKFREDNAAGIDYQGKHYTMYEATQMQRRLERSMRTQKRRILRDEATQDKEKLQINQIRLRRLREEYSRFSKAAGLRTQQERAEVAGFGAGQAKRATATVPFEVRSIDEEYIKMQKLDISRQIRLIKNPDLALPNAKQAIIEPDKFVKYLFNKENSRGYAKGIAFSERLGYDITNWEELSEEIHSRATLYPSRKIGDFGHGMKYEQLMVLYGKKNTPANVVVGWIEENGAPRMTSAYIKEVKEHEN